MNIFGNPIGYLLGLTPISDNCSIPSKGAFEQIWLHPTEWILVQREEEKYLNKQQLLIAKNNEIKNKMYVYEDIQ